MKTSSAEVLVVGAGPVGLTMAAELARHGVVCRIIDKLAAPLPYCRAIGVSPRTLEVWDDMGIARSMIDAGLWLRGTRSMLNGSAIPDVYADLSGLPFESSLGIPQPETERILTEHLNRFGVAVERRVTLTGLTQDERGVQVELTSADESIEKASFRYVIGCDGAHSAVRRLLGILFEGDHYPLGFMLGDVVLDCDLPRGMILRSITPHPGGAPDFMIAIPLPERNRYRVTMLAPARSSDATASEHGLQTEGAAPALEELQTVMDRLLPDKVTLSDMRWSSNFRIGMRLAGRYREGRGFLAGDAAHIHPPTGGQGMNTGIQDAYNLAWKMALVMRGVAGPKLLDSYDAERRPVGAEVVSRTRAASENFGRPETGQRDRLADTQILVNYRGSALSLEAADSRLDGIPVMAGDRAPDCRGLRRAHLRAPLRLFDITRGAESLLLYYAGKSLDATQAALLESMARNLNGARKPVVRVAAICAAGAQVADLVGVAAYTDSDGEFSEVYQPGVGTGYLIRPDGYVGYHGRPVTERGLAEYMASFAS